MTAPAATHRFSTRTAGLLAAAGLAAALPAAANSATGGTFSSVAPTVTAVECLTSCSGIDVVRPGGTIRLTGRDLGTARTAAFRGRAGSADDVTAPILRRTATTATVAVPAGARTGPLAVINSDGLASAARLTVAIDRGAGSAPAGAAVEAKVATRTVFYAGRRKARLSYVLQGTEPAKISIGLVHVASGRLVRSWEPGVVAPGTARELVWDGHAKDRSVAPEGRYRFRVVVGSSPAGGARSAVATAAASQFTFLRHIFPIRGPHDYGTFVNRFGGGRNHGGQDVLASCGTALVAARGGKVVVAGFESGGGGNTVVIDGAGTNLVYVYYHMRDQPLVRVGQHVWTGQLIGFVGSTGSSTACHLHLELHRGGQWYDDSRAFDPLPSLKAWDRLT